MSWPERNAHDITDHILSALTNSMVLEDMRITYHDDDTGSIRLVDDNGIEFVLRVQKVHKENPGREMPRV